MACQLVLFVRMFMILIIDNYKRCVLIKSMFITKGMNTSNEIYRRKDIQCIYIYTISDTDQQSTFHLYAKNA